jgi:short subunit dehydrogenase-like uncharacterized protein
MTSEPRPYDVVLFGAGGFVGAQTVHYFARHAPAGLRWAIAGSSADRLAAAKARAGVGDEVPALVVDGRDATAVDHLASRTRVVLSSAGPFALYSDAIVGACVRRRTDYVDVTGETTWVRSLIDRHHRTAAAEGTRIVPCCGFDSVPSDLGAFLAVRRLQQAHGASCRHARAYFRMAGGLNGGTVATVARLYESGDEVRARDPFLLDESARSSEAVAASGDPTDVRFDPDAEGWVGPFVMARVNTRVVRRSASLFEGWGEPYGPAFDYQEYAKYGGRFARTKAVLVSSALAGFDRAMRGSATRRLVRALLPRPGAGPSPKQMDGGWFRCDVIASDEHGHSVRLAMTHRGDPSNRATVRFVCEAALCLALDSHPAEGRRGGVLTPATALGHPLAERLQASGLEIRWKT